MRSAHIPACSKHMRALRSLLYPRNAAFCRTMSGQRLAVVMFKPNRGLLRPCAG